MSTPNSSTDSKLKPKWQERFDFFDSHGHPGSAEYRQGMKSVTFGKRMRITSNFIAFFFGPVYFFVLGLWKKNLSLLGIWVVIGIVATALDVSDLLARALGMGMAVLYMSTANYAYYLQRTRGIQSWNPFEGMGKRAPTR
ncbi:DUF2628 domain-containing protein [Nocardia uniformis]|uniref:DUF2628 domain-containing protein n=1 Tax=Nocardia uniformis TaxID=53432 RepID=A0A849C5Y5_9NOCA|nr:DUF2628 domain-containing protein [Nocardia uniformis]NNH74042.1 DUF2628 domain-containing protein [Nocardia uniformis]